MKISRQSYPFNFDTEKAIEAIFYIAKRAAIPDRFHVCKILYFADRYHLENYARFVCGDHYVAMEHGPVPSGTYDLIKAADRGEVADLFVDDWAVMPDRDANMEVFSESDIEALDWAIVEFGNIPFKELRQISHDEAWKAATNNGELLKQPYTLRSVFMPLEGIVSTLKDSAALLEYLYEYN